MKRQPLRHVPDGPHVHCQHCNQLSPWKPGQWRWGKCENCHHGYSDMAYINPTTSFYNPVQEYWIKASLRPSDSSFSTLGHHCRTAIIPTFGFAVPDERAIRTIASLGPVVEMGAGRGYWAWCLKQVGCDIIAYNEDVPPQWGEFALHDYLYHPVEVGTPEILREHGDRTLLLVWPPYDEPMASDCLRNWTGKYVCYVGEGYGDCTGDDTYHETLDRCFTLVDHFPLSTWPGVHDSFFLYKRKVAQRTLKKRMTGIRGDFRKREIKENNRYRSYLYSSDPMMRRIAEMREL